METASEQWKLGARDDVYCVARSETVQYQGAKRLIYHVLLCDPYAAMPKRLIQRIRKVMKWASVFKATIASLPDRHWAAIVEGAKEYLGRNTVVEGRQQDGMVVEESDDDEDEVLIDPMFAD